MNSINNDYPFEFSPKLIKFLGEELIHDKKIAISELIKNAYDADADAVSLTIGEETIIIRDNGHGMNEKDVCTGWLVVGNSQKSQNNHHNNKTAKYQRLPIGEKGVGRLGAHKLGNKIQVISKTAQDPEVIFEIDWNRLENTTKLNELPPISILSRENPSVFTDGETGTELTIRDLKENFKDKDIKSLNADLIKLLPPFQHSIQDNFKISFIKKTGLFEDETLLDTKQILEHGLFRYSITFDQNEIKDFHYEFFSPDSNKIPDRKLSLEDAEVKDLIINLQKKPTDPDNYAAIGEVMFQGYIFDEKFARLFKNPYSRDIKNYLKDNGGIRVYRNGLRIYNYGEGGKDNDILDLDRKRAKRLGDNIGYNQLLASIELVREGSKDLIEKTNREGFIHNDAFSCLQRQLDFCMEMVLHCRKIDRANMAPLFGKEYDKADIDTKIKEITSQVSRLEISDTEKKGIQSRLFEFSKEFTQLKDIFLTASNTGLNLTFIVHEIDKIIDHLGKTIQAKDFQQIEKVFLHLKNSIDAYRDTIKLDKRNASLSVDALIRQALFNSQYRLDYHKIECSKRIAPDLHIMGKKGLILGILTNLFDNAIYWLEYYKVERKKIMLNAYRDNEFVHIVVADNGKGFNINFEAALGPFISGRTDESSMGIGLHLTEQVMIAHEGGISHGDWQEEDLPEGFSQGAVIKLTFKGA